MKRFYSVAGCIALLLSLVLTGCIGSKRGEPEINLKISLSTSDSPAKVKLLNEESATFFLQVQSNGAWQIEKEPSFSKWITLDVTEGKGNQAIIVNVQENIGEERSIILKARIGNSTDTFQIIQQGKRKPEPEPGPNPKPNPQPEPTDEHILGDLKLIELPRLAGGAHNYFITHYLKDGSVNYSLEYDTQRRHSRWVAFTFDKNNSKKVTGRTEGWGWDPKVPSQFDTSGFFKGSGFDRGHLVASEDRVHSREANVQTFYYTNMSPQRGPLNQEYWAKLEELVRSWGRDNNFRDILYVAKGGTISDDLIESRRLKGTMVIPQYYWMAVVAQRGTDYQGIAFWVEHKAHPKHTRHLSKAIRIRELEEKTGLDFFHNLPNTIEDRVETQIPSTILWPRL
ncbi:MAG: DNA/RNA non-specific endonuclease [Porphyromonadaceae bacterium]|nr:DNA/RNA non-specific endonuclease [Porphyromonadaceae bacterium]